MQGKGVGYPASGMGGGLRQEQLSLLEAVGELAVGFEQLGGGGFGAGMLQDTGREWA